MRKILLTVILCLAGCVPYGSRIEQHRAAVFRQFPQASQQIEKRGQRTHYVRTGVGRPLVVFVHGSPGSWDAFAEFLQDDELTRLATLVSVDRPGFGDSRPLSPEPSLEAQAITIQQVIDLEAGRVQPPLVILVGHSFGGPVIAHLAARMKIPYAVVFVAASADPDLEKVTWYQTAASWFWVRPLLPRELDNSNQEILPLRKELDNMADVWPQIRGPAIVLQGTDDSLVPPANAEFIRLHLKSPKPEVYYLPGQGHFIPWERPDQIKSVIKTLLSRLQ